MQVAQHKEKKEEMEHQKREREERIGTVLIGIDLVTTVRDLCDRGEDGLAMIKDAFLLVGQKIHQLTEKGFTVKSDLWARYAFLKYAHWITLHPEETKIPMCVLKAIGQKGVASHLLRLLAYGHFPKNNGLVSATNRALSRVHVVN